VCGRHELFDRAGKFVRESFLCPTCGSSYRYRHQAEMIIAHLSRRGSSSIDELVEEPEFASMDIYEPGTLGPFRKRLSGLPGYVTSVYSPDVEPGELHEGVRCENLEALTFDDSSIDLIISSDVFEHVRHPDKGFAETLRVLRPGGLHIFTVPIRWPRALPSVPRVDVSGVEDVHLLEPNYHFASLVYNDFGIDLVDRLTAAGFHALLPRGLSDNITVVARRP
jgi:SAM-dependent methyltransferase